MKVTPANIKILDTLNHEIGTWEEKIGLENMVYRLMQAGMPHIEQITGEIKDIALKYDFHTRIVEAEDMGISKHYACHSHMLRFSNEKYNGGYYFFLQEKMSADNKETLTMTWWDKLKEYFKQR